MHIINKFNLFVHILFHPQEPQILFGYNHLICFILFAIKLLAEKHFQLHKIQYNHKMCVVYSVSDAVLYKLSVRL